MSIFDKLLPVKESDKIRNKDQSEKLTKELLADDGDLIDITPHQIYTKTDRENVYRFTIRLLSLDFLNKLGADRRVKNVFWTSRHSHPGGGADSISLRHQIFVEYY